MDTPSNQRACNVLLAEDNPANVALMKAILSMVDCHVTIASTGLAAVQAFKGADFDLVLMDYHMPEMNGVEAVEHIRRLEASWQRRPAWIAALTGSAMPQEVERCLAAGMDEVVTKPVDVLKLRDLVKRVCERLHSTA